MPEFLVRPEGSPRWVRVDAPDPGAVMGWLEPGRSGALVFSSGGGAWRLEEGRPGAVIVDARLPLAVWVAWWGVRHPRVRLIAQYVCWVALAVLLLVDGLTGRRFQAPPVAMVLVGALNLLAWWWWESDRGRLESKL